MHLVTKPVAKKILASYQVDDSLPKTGEKKIIAFPLDPTRFDFRKVTVTKVLSFKSTYGKTLYNFEFE